MYKIKRSLASLSATLLLGAMALSPFAGGVALAQPVPPGGPPQLPPLPANETMVAGGLNAPRGIKFGPDGSLYVAEAGVGGTNSTKGQCAPVGNGNPPVTGSKNGSRIMKVAADGTVSVAVANLPSDQSVEQGQIETIGVADVALVGDTLYGLIAGGGCSHGVPDVPNAVIKANGDGTWTQVADLSAYHKANPIAKPDAADFEPDGNWYSMVAAEGALYAIEANGGELIKITTDGKVSRVVDLSATYGHIVPTGMDYHDGNFYVGDLGNPSFRPGGSRVYKITTDGQVSVYAQGLSAITGLAVGSDGTVFVTEFAATGAPGIGTGGVVRINMSGGLYLVGGGLTAPTGGTFGPDGKLYVSNFSAGGPPGSGQVVMVDTSVAGTPVMAPVGMPQTGTSSGSNLSEVALLAALLVLAGALLRVVYTRKAADR
ncbi:MAG: ScyD/ScyE family protein [Chloroflexota bacterium]